MTPEALARVHARAMTAPRPWNAEEFASLLAQNRIILAGGARAFALGGLAGDDVEILTIATDPACRRRGLGRQVLADLHRMAAGRGAVRAFLEVSEANGAARALYESAGYEPVGCRSRYYRTAEGWQDALVLARALPDPAATRLRETIGAAP